MPVMGTETEYGIVAPDAPGADPDWLSGLVVDAHPGPATPVLSAIHNRVLGNGARLYVDHGHPEYATPETTDATQACVHDLAGDLLVARAAAAASERAGTRIAVFKNNTDGKGSSYGHHENYLVGRGLEWLLLASVLPSFLVTRTVFTGAGRVGLGPAGERPGFQLAQRADFFERVSGLDTTRHRGILNTRDEPHATPSRWRRLHTIAGDANRNPYATWLRLGTTALLLAAVEAGVLPPVDGVRLADPVAAFRDVSRDLRLGRALPLVGGGVATALDVQARFRDAAGVYAARHDFPEADDLLAEWSSVLDDLARDPASTADRLDWTAKLALLERLRARDGLAWDAVRLARLDLAWAELADSSPFEALRRSGRLVDWVDAEEVTAAASSPPRDTRAFARGHLVSDHPAAVVAATWDSVLLRDARGVLHNLRMGEPTSWAADAFDPAATLEAICAAAGASSPRARDR